MKVQSWIQRRSRLPLRRAKLDGAKTAALELERGWPMPKVPLMLLFRDWKKL